MILTSEEYHRGFIDFDADVPDGCAVELWARTADRPEDDTEWTGPYVVPGCSKVLAPNRKYMQLNIKWGSDDSTKIPTLKKVRWERDGETYIWPGEEGFTGPPAAFILGRDYGYSHRLVLRPRRALWPEPFVIIDKLMRVRFSKGPLKGYRVVATNDDMADPTYAGGGTFEEITTEDDVLEILATVPTTDKDIARLAARIQVEAITGLLALCLGEQVLGERVFEDQFFSDSAGEEVNLLIPVKGLEVLSVTREIASCIDHTLSEFYGSSIRTSIGLALRWYTKALESESDVDRFIAFFIGLETLATGYFASLDPKPIRKEYTQLQNYLSTSQPSISPGLRDTVLKRLADFPLTDKFKAYWKDRFQKETRLGHEFPNLNRLRSEVLHGKARMITIKQVNSTRKLLERALARELGLEDIIDTRHATPRVLEAGFTFILRKPDN